jgi:hypothetical protein
MGHAFVVAPPNLDRRNMALAFTARASLALGAAVKPKLTGELAVGLSTYVRLRIDDLPLLLVLDDQH